MNLWPLAAILEYLCAAYLTFVIVSDEQDPSFWGCLFLALAWPIPLVLSIVNLLRRYL